jgi:hypothetical protein
MDIEIVIESKPPVNQNSELISHPLDVKVIHIDNNDHNSTDDHRTSNIRYNSFFLIEIELTFVILKNQSQ